MHSVRLLAAISLVTTAATQCFAGDPSRWTAQPTPVHEWFTSLYQPDNPLIPCCGEADAVEADEWIAHPDGAITATITNGHGLLSEDTKIKVPSRKVKYDATNPTGHSILFYSHDQGVYCFVAGPLH